MQNNIMMYLNNIILIILLVIIVIILTYPILKRFFIDNFNGSGYGMNKRFGKMNTLIPLNDISKSTDFKLFSLISQIRFSYVKPSSNYVITKTSDGIISKTPQVNSNIILFPGLTDYILRQNGREVWPRQHNNINNKESAIVYENNEGHFNTITTLLESLNYKNGDKLNTVTYDFRKINFDELINQFLTYLKPNTVIIAYDFGCVIANMCINYLKNSASKMNIVKLLLICPTIGGVPMTLRDYFSENHTINPNIIENYQSILMSMPHQQFYDKPIAIYNSVSYKANNISELMKYDNKPFELFNQQVKLQELSFENPGIDCVIVANEQFDTPIAYNFKNNLSEPPERYLLKHNNQYPNSNIHTNNTVEGLQTMGDGVVPISSIYRLKEMWNNNNKTKIEIELIEDKDHFTILKSYKLALIIMANI